MHLQGSQGTKLRYVGNGATELVVVEIPGTVGHKSIVL